MILRRADKVDKLTCYFDLKGAYVKPEMLKM